MARPGTSIGDKLDISIAKLRRTTLKAERVLAKETRKWQMPLYNSDVRIRRAF